MIHYTNPSTPTRLVCGATLPIAHLGQPVYQTVDEGCVTCIKCLEALANAVEAVLATEGL